jgi:hypothetical protein
MRTYPVFLATKPVKDVFLMLKYGSARTALIAITAVDAITRMVIVRSATWDFTSTRVAQRNV